MEISEDIQLFIKNHAELIQRSDFPSLYFEATAELYKEEIGVLTEILYESGIDPLTQASKEVPPYFCVDRKITEFTIPAWITQISRGAFKECEELQRISLPQGLELIDSRAFYGCVDLKQVSLPDALSTIGREAFAYCNSLEELSFNPTLQTIKLAAFKYSGLRKVQIPQGVVHIELDTFRGCAFLTEVECRGAERIGLSAFEECSNLKKIHLGANLQEVSPRAFAYCPQLELIEFDGTKERWQKLHVSLPNRESWTVVCADGTLVER